MIMTLLREAIGGSDGLVGKAGGARVESLVGTWRGGTSERATRRRQACGCGKVMRLAGGCGGDQSSLLVRPRSSTRRRRNHAREERKEAT